MSQILERKPFYIEQERGADYLTVLVGIYETALSATTHFKETLFIGLNYIRSLDGLIKSTECIADQLPECDRRNFSIATIASSS